MDALHAKLLQRVLTGPDPDEAPARLHRFVGAAEERPGGLEACVPSDAAADLLVLLVGQSSHFSREIARDPHRLAELAADPWLRREKPEEVMHAERAAMCDGLKGEALAAALRQYRDQEYLRLCFRELGYGRPEEVGRELAALAAACLEGALASAWSELRARHGEPNLPDGFDKPHNLARGQEAGLSKPSARCRFAVFGMGKLGAEELNFSSDIDLIFLYESDAGAATDGTSLHEYFSRLAEHTRRLVADSGCFRIDLRLRPEGTRGPLVNSLDAAVQYYETWARPWEKQAWIKARAVAGDRDFGDETLEALSPFVWPRSGVASAVEDVRAMMRKVRAELGDRDDVKLGPGGIREIEFFVQALQRIHAGRRKELRERGTLKVLERLLFAGLVSEREQQKLGDAYEFLRRLEHRLQLDELRQTHAMPNEPARRALIGRRLGFYPDDFESHLALHRKAVEGVYATLGREPEEASPQVTALLDPASDRDTIRAALASLGFRNPEASADEIELLRQKPHSPFSPVATGGAARAAPLLLDEAVRSPDPDLVVRRLVDLVGRSAVAEIVWRLAAESPAFARLLVSLLATSDFLAKILVAHPSLVEQLVAGGGARRTDHATAIAEALAGADEDDEEGRLNVLRRYKHDEILRIGLRDVGGEIDVDEVSSELTALAEALLRATLDTVTPNIFRRYGRPRTPFAVLALGRLGAGELSYTSDLDLIFLFGDDEAPVDGGRGLGAFEVMSRLAQRLIHGLGAFLPAGRLYEVDTRLRPSGQQGALVSSLGGFQRYHAEHSALWERQALIKARIVAGDAALGAEAEAIAAQHVWGGSPLDPRSTAEDIGRLRARMERELSGEGEGRYHIKLGRGGLVDVEFLVQYLALVHGPTDASLRQRSTSAALAALRTSGLFDSETFAVLDEGYRFLRRLDSRLRIVHDRSISSFTEGDPESGELTKLARRLGRRGARPGEELVTEYRRHTAAIRSVYARFLPVPSP